MTNAKREKIRENLSNVWSKRNVRKLGLIHAFFFKNTKGGKTIDISEKKFYHYRNFSQTAFVLPRTLPQAIFKTVF